MRSHELFLQEVPLLLQVRLFYNGMVAKGTLLVNLKVTFCFDCFSTYRLLSYDLLGFGCDVIVKSST